MHAQDWRGYLTERFAGDHCITLRHHDDFSVITDASGRSRTEIQARYFRTDKALAGLDFLNPDSPGWNRLIMRERYHSSDRYSDSGEHFFCSGQFTPERLAEAESWLAVPLYRGWTEHAYYVDGRHVISELVWRQGGTRHEMRVTMEDAGCWMGLFDLLRYRESRLSSMDKRTIVIPPMIEAA